MGSSTHISTTNLGAAAMPPPTSAARRCTGKQTRPGKRTRPAVTPPPPARRNRGARPAASNRTSLGLPHRTPPAPAMGAHEMPPQPRRAVQRARSLPPGARPRSWPSPARARAAPGPPQPPPTHGPPCAPFCGDTGMYHETMETVTPWLESHGGVVTKNQHLLRQARLGCLCQACALTLRARQAAPSTADFTTPTPGGVAEPSHSRYGSASMLPALAGNIPAVPVAFPRRQVGRAGGLR